MSDPVKDREKRFRVVKPTKGRPEVVSGLVTEAHAYRIQKERGRGHAVVLVRTRRCSGRSCRRRVLPNLICVHCGCVAKRMAG